MADTPHQQGLLPVPDPTLLTTAQLFREIKSLSDLTDVKLDAIKGIQEQQQNLIKQQFDQHRSVDDEKFKSVQIQFSDRDNLIEKVSAGTKLALDIALQNLNKQVEQIYAQLALSNKNSDDRINDLKSRLDRGEGKSTGLKDGWGYVVGAVGLVIAAVMMWVALKR